MIKMVNKLKLAANEILCHNGEKMAVISDEHDSNQNHIMVEKVDGISYTFDTADCAMMFKRFSSVYGRDFADE